MEATEKTAVNRIARENAFLLSFTARFEGRGFAGAARLAELEMEKTEEAARQKMPEAYRLHILTGNGRGDRLRQADSIGRKTMSVDDYLAYFAGRRRDGNEVTAVEPENRSARLPAAKTRAESRLAGARTVQRKKQTLLQKKVQEAKNAVLLWIKTENRVEETAGRRNRLPISTIASFFVITLCLMMIISASVMVAGAQYDVSELKSEVSELKEQAEALTDKLESDIDYLAVYRTATEEYGMIDSAYVSAAYLENGNGNTVEVFEAEETVRFGLGTLLSAIGIDIGTR